jgi:hypothetical protein
MAKLPLVAALQADPKNVAEPLAKLARLDRYERRARSRRKRAIRTFQEAVASTPPPHAAQRGSPGLGRGELANRT